MGTPTYMAPEQFNGTGTSARTDQFAFCVALYEAVYGERPFLGVTYPELAASVMYGEVLAAPKTAHVPGWLRRVLLRGLATDPAARFPAITDLLVALAREPTKRRRRTLAAIAIPGVLVVGLGAFALRSRGAELCSGGAARVAEVWNGERRAAIETVFHASTRPLAAGSLAKLGGMLDAWGHTWELGYHAACADTRVHGAQSERLLDLRMQCLTRRLDETRATIDLLAAGGSDAIDHALDAAMALPAVEPCADRAALLAEVAPPEGPIASTKVALVRSRLDEARGMRRLARYKDALVIATEALASARATGYVPVIAEALFVVGSAQHELGDLAAAATLDDATHTAAEAGAAPLMIDATASLVLLLALDTSRFDAAEELATLAESTAVHAHPTPDITARLEDAFGILLDTRGRPADARPHLEQALAVAETQLGPDDPATISALTQLGNLDKNQGHYADARARLQRVLAYRERTYGKDHPAVAAALNNLGRVELADGKPEVAKPLYERALAIRIASLGPDHPDVGDSLNNLGTFYSEQDDQEAAQKYYEQAIAVYTKVFGAASLAVAGGDLNLGAAMLGRGDNDSAKLHFEHALAVYEAAHGPDHPTVANAVSNLATVAQNQHKLDEALALYQRALRIDERVYGPDHPDVADALSNIATVLKEQKKLDEAETITTRSISVVEKVYGANHPRMAMSLSNLGSLQIARNEYPAALVSFQRALAIFEAKLGPTHPYLSYPLRGAGDALIELKRHEEAVPLLERALAIRTGGKMPGNLVAEVRFLLVQALTPDPSQRARARAEATTALAEYTQADDADDAAEVRLWLAAHR